MSLYIISYGLYKTFENVEVNPELTALPLYNELTGNFGTLTFLMGDGLIFIGLHVSL